MLEILVKEGDTVKQGSGLMELETDKATVTVPSPSSGKIVSIKVKAGDTVEVGSVIVTMETSGAGGTASGSETSCCGNLQRRFPPAPAAQPQAAAPAPAPSSGETLPSLGLHPSHLLHRLPHPRQPQWFNDRSNRPRP